MIDVFSPNMIKTYLSCPKKFYYKYIESISMPSSSLPFEKGKKIHALANYYLQGTNIERLEKALNNKEKETWELLKNNEFYNKEFFKSEFQIQAKVDKYWIGGRIDAIVKDNENYYILDYKTGATPQKPEYDFQTMIYLICTHMYLKEYNTLSFVYINLKEKNNYIIEFTPEMKKLYKAKIIEVCKKITEMEMFESRFIFEENKTEQCQNMLGCEYSKICL